MSANTVFYRGTTAGSFKVRGTVSDTGGSGAASILFGALGGVSTGWTFTGSTATTPGAGLYDSNLYSWAAATATSPTAAATPNDAALNAGAATTLTFTNDVTAPASVYTYPAAAGYYNAAGWTGSITGTASDAGAGLSTVQVAIQQGAGNYYDGSTFANAGITWLTATGTSAWSYAIAAAKLTTGNTYTISVRSTDNVGNIETAVTRSFVYDTVAPSETLTLNTISQNGGLNQAFKSGNTVFYRGTTAGSFKVQSTVTDALSGPASATFSALGGVATGLDVQRARPSRCPPVRPTSRTSTPGARRPRARPPRT